MIEISENDWEKILFNIKNTLEYSDIRSTWFKDLSIKKIVDDTIYISAADEKSAEIIRDIFSDNLRNQLIDFTNNPNIELSIDYYDENKLDNNEKHLNNNMNQRKDYSFIASNLTENYTFENFVVGSNNNLTTKFALDVARNPGTKHNPLFIYGKSGVGKTHLLQAIGHKVLNLYPKKKVKYITSEFFTNELIKAIGQSESERLSFQNKFRNQDVLIIDDLQFIAGKESTQEEFFHTFNELFKNKKQIIVSSDQPPKNMKTLEERIRSRLVQGIITDISSPDYEMRVAILKKKLEQSNRYIDDKVIEFIAENITSNVRELEGSLNKLITMMDIENYVINVDTARDLLKDIIDDKTKKQLSPQIILNVVAEHFKISSDDIIGKSRKQYIADARQICIYLIRKLLPEIKTITIADFLGKRVHSTISAANTKIADKLTEEKDFDFDNEKHLTKTIEILENKIKNNYN